MKKSMNFNPLFILLTMALAFSSCGHFHDDPKLSVWAGGLWIIPWILGLTSAWFGYKAYASYKKYYKSEGTFSIGSLTFSIILFVALIVVLIVVNADK
jgi:uncharacterized membrane protein